MIESRDFDAQYRSILGDVSRIIDVATRSVIHSVNAMMTAAYWLIAQYIVEFEQLGEQRAAYGIALIERLGEKTRRTMSAESSPSLQVFRPDAIWQIPERSQTEYIDDVGRLFADRYHPSFPLPWPAYVRLLSVKNLCAREFYKAEALGTGLHSRTKKPSQQRSSG